MHTGNSESEEVSGVQMSAGMQRSEGLLVFEDSAQFRHCGGTPPHSLVVSVDLGECE